MSDVDRKLGAGVQGNEAMFQVSEALYSRTDKRGVILGGNDVFQRMSGHDWSGLIGAPHKIIRHPDMPRGVFELLWQRLKEGKPTGAYVKNRRSCGRFYWVFALVSPSEEGYISTRLKPTSPLRAQVEEAYAALLAREAQEGLTPEQSAAELLGWVRGEGYASYDTFQSHALASEFEARARLMHRPVGTELQRYLDISRAISEVQRETALMTDAFQAIRTVPMNMRIIASRLENVGGPISAISVNYSQMLEEMSTWVTTFVDGDECVFARMRDSILFGQFLAFAAATEREMQDLLSAMPTDIAEIDLKTELAAVDGHRVNFLALAADRLIEVEREARRFARSIQDMKRFVTGLSSTRMMCKIESASLSDSGTALNGIVEQLDHCQTEIEDRLARVMELNAVIQNNTSMLRAHA